MFIYQSSTHMLPSFKIPLASTFLAVKKTNGANTSQMNTVGTIKISKLLGLIVNLGLQPVYVNLQLPNLIII